MRSGATLEATRLAGNQTSFYPHAVVYAGFLTEIAGIVMVTVWGSGQAQIATRL